MEHELKELIKKADLAIKNEDFDTLLNYYTDDAILVVKPGTIAKGKDEIKKAFVAIAKYFNNSIVPTQGEMIILEAGDTALVLSQTLLEADKKRTRNIQWIEGQRIFLRKIHKANGCVQLITHMVQN